MSLPMFLTIIFFLTKKTLTNKLKQKITFIFISHHRIFFLENNYKKKTKSTQKKDKKERFLTHSPLHLFSILKLLVEKSQPSIT
jgi:hypothetical protein